MTHAANPKLQRKLIAMMNADQVMRNAAIKDPKKWDHSLDVKHTEQLKQIIDNYGWPTISLVGSEASFGAWLIAQHADHDLDFQKACLALLKSLPESEVSLRNIAYLEDRILVAEQRPQLYGTQYVGAGAERDPKLIFDPANLDKRRESVGLEAYAEYEGRIRATYGENVRKRPRGGATTY